MKKNKTLKSNVNNNIFSVDKYVIFFLEKNNKEKKHEDKKEDTDKINEDNNDDKDKNN